VTGKKRSEDVAKTRTAQDETEPLCPLPTDTARTRSRSRSVVKTFSEWIENEPKEKWALLYDTDGARYGIMTTNFAEVYNWVMRGVRGLPLVATVEFIVHGCTDYFRDRFTKNQAYMQDPDRYFGRMMIYRLLSICILSVVFVMYVSNTCILLNISCRYGADTGAP
jgi:hypothetical protein